MAEGYSADRPNSGHTVLFSKGIVGDFQNTGFLRIIGRDIYYRPIILVLPGKIVDSVYRLCLRLASNQHSLRSCRHLASRAHPSLHAGAGEG